MSQPDRPSSAPASEPSHEAPVALVLVHADPDRRDLDGFAGVVGEALQDRGWELRTRTAVAPVPAGDVDAADLVVVLGSAASAYDDSLPWIASEMDLLRDLDDRATPILGICFGAQILARSLGGSVERAPRPEIGWFEVETDDPGLVERGPWFETHSDRLSLPPGATEIARTADASQAFVLGPHLAVQFHPEITPDVLETWMRAWDRDAAAKMFARQGLTLDGVIASVDESNDANRGRAARLVDRFLASRRPATAIPPARVVPVRRY